MPVCKTMRYSSTPSSTWQRNIGPRACIYSERTIDRNEEGEREGERGREREGLTGTEGTWRHNIREYGCSIAHVYIYRRNVVFFSRSREPVM